jgi:hypothetical protein
MACYTDPRSMPQSTAFHAIAHPKNADISTGSSEAQSTNSEAPSTSNTSRVATAVFAIPELLFLVIEAVPRQRRTLLRRVSKSWQAAMMKMGHVVELIGCRFIPHDLRPWLPLYLLGIIFGINRVFSNSLGNESTGGLETMSC